MRDVAAHAMRTVLKCEFSEAGQINYAANSFSSVNRNVFLRNIKIIWNFSPAMLQTLTKMESSVGMSQGDPAALVI